MDDTIYFDFELNDIRRRAGLPIVEGIILVESFMDKSMSITDSFNKVVSKVLRIAKLIGIYSIAGILLIFSYFSPDGTLSLNGSRVVDSISWAAGKCDAAAPHGFASPTTCSLASDNYDELYKIYGGKEEMARMRETAQDRWGYIFNITSSLLSDKEKANRIRDYYNEEMAKYENMIGELNDLLASIENFDQLGRIGQFVKKKIQAPK